MRTLVSASLTAALIVAATPAMAAGSSQESTLKSEAGARKICRMIERTGTRMHDRVCLTAEQWKKVDKIAAE